MPEATSDGVDFVIFEPHHYTVGEVPEAGQTLDTPWVEYGTAGTSWHTIKESCVDKMTSAPISSLADVTQSLSKGIVVLAISLYQWALTGDLMREFNTFVVDTVETVGKGIWNAFFYSVVIISALWMYWVGIIKKRVLEMLGGFCWMVAATTLSTLLIASPGLVLDTGSDITMAGSRLAFTIVGQIDMSATNIDECPDFYNPNVDSEDSQSSGGGQQDQISNGGNDDSRVTVESTSNWMWSSMLCRPWLLGQVGSSDESKKIANDHGQDLLYAQSLTRTERHHIDEGNVDEADLVEQKQQVYEETSEEIEEQAPVVYATHAGDRPGSRLGMAAFSLFVSCTAGGIILALGFSIMMMRVAFLLLVLLGPFLLLAGVHPGIGRRYLIKWLELTLGVLLKQVIYTFVLLMFGLLYVMVFATALPWFGKMIVLSMVALGVLYFRKKLQHVAGTTVSAVMPTRVIERIGESRSQNTTSHSDRRTTRADSAGSRPNHGSAKRNHPHRRNPNGDSPSGGAASSSGPRGASGDTRDSSRSPGANAGSAPHHASSARGREAPSGDPGGSGRNRGPEYAPRLQRVDDRANHGRTSPSGGASENTASDDRAREEHSPRERGSTWGDVHGLQRGAQRRRDWGSDRP